MPRKKKYEDGAAKQKAYRQRKAREKRNDLALRFDRRHRANIDRPPVRYFGGKWRIAPWIINFFPEHVCYCEPFCGGASVFFRKEPVKFNIINDLNSDIVNFFDVLRSRPDELTHALHLTPHSREEHRRSYESADDPLEKARRFYVRNWQSFGSGEGRYNTGWRFQYQDNRGCSVNTEWSDIERLYEVAARLKLAQIENDDALNIFRRYDNDKTLFYVDPPYTHSERHRPDGYKYEMDDSQHTQLAETLNNLQGMVILSGYDSDLYRELYAGWEQHTKTVQTNGKGKALECVWLSPATYQANYPLFKEA